LLYLPIVPQSHEGSLLIGIFKAWIWAIFWAIKQLSSGSRSSMVRSGRAYIIIIFIIYSWAFLMSISYCQVFSRSKCVIQFVIIRFLLLTGMNSSTLPPGKTPYSLGPSFLSESRVNITDSVIKDSKAPSPWIYKWSL